MEKENCFIITPIGDEKSEIRRHIDGIIEAVIIPALENEFEVVVSHKMSSIGTINKQIIKHIYNDKLVIANLTDVNPNVMYELAFRHSLGKPVIIIAEVGTQLPFDIRVERTIFYKNDAKGTLELKNTLLDFISKIDYEDKSSPIYDIIKEINNEEKIVDISKGSNANGETDSLKYILNRLNSIEDSVKSLNPKNSSDNYQRVRAIIRYENAPNDINHKNIHNRIVSIITREKNVKIRSISVNEDEKEIIISMSHNIGSKFDLFEYIREVLENMGFSGVAMDFYDLY